MVPDNVSVPAPVLVNAPVVFVLAPEIVRFVPPLVTSIVDDVPVVRTKFRLVETVEPVYCNVPPPSVRFAAVVVEAPMSLFTPPFANVPTLSVPALIVVAPV